jgi:hypothetical protein
MIKDNDNCVEIVFPSTLRAIVDCKQQLIVLLLSIHERPASYGKSKTTEDLNIINKNDKTYQRFSVNDDIPWVDDVFHTSGWRTILPAQDYKYSKHVYGECCHVLAAMVIHLFVLLPVVSSRDTYAFWLSSNDADLPDVIERYLSWMQSVVPTSKQELANFDYNTYREENKHNVK